MLGLVVGELAVGGALFATLRRVHAKTSPAQLSLALAPPPRRGLHSSSASDAAVWPARRASSIGTPRTPAALGSIPEGGLFATISTANALSLSLGDGRLSTGGAAPGWSTRFAQIDLG